MTDAEAAKFLAGIVTDQWYAEHGLLTPEIIQRTLMSRLWYLQHAPDNYWINLKQSQSANREPEYRQESLFMITS